MATALQRANLDHGTSSILRAAFACVTDASAVDGSPRYTEKTLHDLRVAVVCRSYSKAVYELCHLVAALGANNCRYVESLWHIERGTKFAFQNHFHNHPPNNSNAIAGSNGITLNFNDGAFTVTYGRMPFLNAFLEFLFTSVGFDAIDRLLRPLSGVPLRIDVINTTAKEIQRVLYDYLLAHLPPLQQQRRERHFLSYLETTEQQIGDIDVINDAAVLSYWRDAAFDVQTDAVTYEVVYRTAWKLILALEAAYQHYAVEGARPIGLDREKGEIEPADVATVAMTFYEESSPLDRVLDAVEQGVRLLSAREIAMLKGLPLDERVERRLPLSVIRNATHGFTQRRLTAARRRGESDLEEILAEDGALDYHQCLTDIDVTAQDLDALCLAALWALHQSERPAAIDIAMTIAPDIDWGALVQPRHDEENVVSFSAHTAASRFFATEPRERGDEISALLKEAKNAWSKVNRSGFKDIEDDDALDVLETAVPATLELVQRVQSFVLKTKKHEGLETIQSDDARVFGDVFRRLYCHGHDEVAYGD
jgi:hypothetical protein